MAPLVPLEDTTRVAETAAAMGHPLMSAVEAAFGYLGVAAVTWIASRLLVGRKLTTLSEQIRNGVTKADMEKIVASLTEKHDAVAADTAALTQEVFGTRGGTSLAAKIEAMTERMEATQRDVAAIAGQMKIIVEHLRT